MLRSVRLEEPMDTIVDETRAEAERCLDRSVDWRTVIMHRKGTGKASCRARSLVEES